MYAMHEPALQTRGFGATGRPPGTPARPSVASAHSRSAATRTLLGNVAGALCAALVACAAARADDPENCLYCHQFPGLSRYDAETKHVSVFYVDPSYVHSVRGPHARLTCTDCHPRDEVSVVPHGAVTRVDCTRTCHLADTSGQPQRFSHADIGVMLDQSVHARETLSTLNFSRGPLLREGQSACLYCHDEPLFRDPTGLLQAWTRTRAVTDRCDSCHSTQAPTDVAYFVRHVASRLAPSRPTLELAQVCAVCHSDPLILKQFSMKDGVASFVRSYHGKAALLGDASTANCLSCHVRNGQDAHRMFAPANPESAVHASRVAQSCRSTECHPGATKEIAGTSVHLDLPSAFGTLEYALAAAFIVLTVVSFGPSALIVTLELARQLVLGGNHHDTRARRLVYAILAHPQGERALRRISVGQRYQHWILAALFAALALTGFPMKFAEHAWARWTIEQIGGLGIARALHHGAGLALLIGVALHAATVLVSWWRRSREPAPEGGRLGLRRGYLRLPLAITPDDGRRMAALLAYLVGRRKERPQFGRFSAAEKFEYLGVMWGTVLLGLTGLLLWGEQIASHLFGGRVFNLAAIIHTFEAFLAIIHVGILHIYNVMLAPAVMPLSPATLTGRTPEAKLAEEHGEFVAAQAAALGISVEGAGHG